MNPPPSPVSSSTERQIHISRGGSVFGVWPASAIRPMLVAGDLKPSDFFWYEGADGWRRLVTEPPTTATPYPYVGDDRPFYFIREGLLYGPRTAAEIDAFLASGWLTGDALITIFTAEQWWTINEVIKLDGGNAAAPNVTGQAPAFDWVEKGIRAYVGDPIAGAEIGIHAVRKAFAWITDAGSAPSQPPMPSPNTPAMVECARCRAPILPGVYEINDGVCFRCDSEKRE